MNPGGSIKDRSSLGMIKSALEAGELKPNGPILEGKFLKQQLNFTNFTK